MKVWGIFSTPLDEDFLLELWADEKLANDRVEAMKKDERARVYKPFDVREIEVRADLSMPLPRIGR